MVTLYFSAICWGRGRAGLRVAAAGQQERAAEGGGLFFLVWSAGAEGDVADLVDL